MTTNYRWDAADAAAGYDAAAEHVHPFYLEIQDTILDLLGQADEARFLVVDLGGGSGRLAERILSRYGQAQVVVIDQSDAFLEIARQRMAPFHGRGECLLARLQDNWAKRLTDPPAAIVSMSAIHHLAPLEKQQVYGECQTTLAPGGVLLNGDEIRATHDADYRHSLETWAAHMRMVAAAGLMSEAFRQMCETWQDRNIAGFGQPRTSGDDCHETVATQLGYLREAGFARADAPWQKQMWTVLRAVK